MRTHTTFHDEDIIGKKFNRLTPISKISGKKTKWQCLCDCGNTTEAYAWQLVRNIKKSCGCLEKESRERMIEKNTKHGMSDTILYSKWEGMKCRCYNPNYRRYDRYGGRGIKVCDEWLGEHGFENFAKWAYNTGFDDTKKGYEQSIDRINMDDDYCPENCRWTNQLEQVKNRSNAYLITDTDGEKLTHYQFGLKHGIPEKKLFVYRRMKKGLSAQDILNEWNEYIKYSSGNYFTIGEAADFYGASISCVKIWVRKKLLNAVKVRGKLYIPKGQTRPYSNE